MMKKTILILSCFCFIATAAYAGWATLTKHDNTTGKAEQIEYGTEANPIYIKLIN